MGEMAEYLINGDDCSGCGEYLGDGPGYARLCSACAREENPDPSFFVLKNQADVAAAKAYLTGRHFTLAEWGVDAKGNPTLRVANKKRWKRVATIVCRNHKMKHFMEQAMTELN